MHIDYQIYYCSEAPNFHLAFIRCSPSLIIYNFEKAPQSHSELRPVSLLFHQCRNPFLCAAKGLELESSFCTYSGTKSTPSAHSHTVCERAAKQPALQLAACAYKKGSWTGGGRAGSLCIHRRRQLIPFPKLSGSLLHFLYSRSE